MPRQRWEGIGCAARKGVCVSEAMPELKRFEKRRSERRVIAGVCAALVVLAFVIYARTARFDFISVDDSSYIWLNPHVRDGLNWSDAAWALTGARAANWHPMTWLSHMTDVSLFGLKAGGHHVSSAAIHAANSVLLFLLLAGTTGTVWKSAFVAALFAAHPMNVESVAWIAERKNVLSTLFWILTLMAYAGYARAKHLRSARYAFVLVLYALGLMAKPMLVTLPLVLLVMDFWPLTRLQSRGRSALRQAQDGVRPALIDKTPMLVMAAAVSWVTLIVQKQGGMTRPLEQFSMGERLANMFVAYVGYILKMFWPRDLCMLYPHPGGSLPVWQPAVCAFALAIMTWLAFRLRNRAPYVLAGWLWYVVALVPVIGVVQVGPQAMADRYGYVPLIGLFVIAVWGTADITGNARSRAAAAAGAAIVIALTAASYHQVGYWRDTSSIFRRTLAVTGNHLPVACSFVGSMWRAGMMPEAVRVLRETDDPAGMLNGVGVLLARVGAMDPAEAMYREALLIEPNYAAAHNNLGVLLAKQKRYAEAAAELGEAVRLRPDYALAHHSLGVALDALGRKDEAISHWQRALEIEPGLKAARERIRRK